jgi:predicted RNase H-like HicB family nuclease
MDPDGILHLTAIVWQEEDWFVAWAPQVEVISQGETIERALANLRDAIDGVLAEEPGRIGSALPSVATTATIDVPAPT